jgi:DNA-binding MarR family transcriptional regulator
MPLFVDTKSPTANLERSDLEAKSERADRISAEPIESDERKPSWTFLSNHAHVLLVLAGDPEVKLREIAERVGITERAVQRIVTDLKDGRYIEIERLGRRSRYRLHPELPLRHPVEAHRNVAHLLALILGS